MLIGLLAACCCEADRQKIEYIYLHYEKIIFYVINRIINDQKTSEDLTHDLFVRLIEMADRIDLADLKKLRSLLVILAKHTAIDYERKQKNSVTDENISENLCGSLAEDGRTPDEALLDHEASCFDRQARRRLYADFSVKISSWVQQSGDCQAFEYPVGAACQPQIRKWKNDSYENDRR